MIVKTVQKPDSLILCIPSELEQLKKQAQKISLSEILYDLSGLRDCLDRISGTVGKRTEFEMCMIRLCSPQLDSSRDAILTRLDRLEAQLRSGVVAVSNSGIKEPELSAPQLPEPDVNSN